MRMDKKLECSIKEKVLRRLAKLLEPAGFRRSKPTFFTRTTLPVIEFVHLHKFTFEPSFRAHTGIRVINDPFVAVALNGPDSDTYRDVASPVAERHYFRYHEGEESVDRCAHNIAEFVSAVAEAWFKSFHDHERLLSSPDSPLTTEARAALERALAGVLEEQYVAKTRELLNAP